MMKSKSLKGFEIHLINEEKSVATIKKYIHDVSEFLIWLANKHMDKRNVLLYKSSLTEKYAPASVNAVLSSLNRYFDFLERRDLRVKTVKIQKRIFAPCDRELTKTEYERLLSAARKKNNIRLYMLMQTICSLGIRVSELKYITAEALSKGVAEIDCKSKHRQVFLPKQLCQMLTRYARERKIKSGPVFITKNGNPPDRSNIWSEMKKLCKEANVPSNKVFPHNLRHLFARTFYRMQKDIVRLADVLGHSNINTTRIYTMESGEACRKQMQRLGLLLCKNTA